MVTHGCQTAGGEVQPSLAQPQCSAGPLPRAQPDVWYLGGCVVIVHELLRGHSLNGTACVWPYLNEVGCFLRNRKAFLEPNNGTSHGAVSEQVRQGIFHRPVPAAVSLPVGSEHRAAGCQHRTALWFGSPGRGVTGAEQRETFSFRNGSACQQMAANFREEKQNKALPGQKKRPHICGISFLSFPLASPSCPGRSIENLGSD